LTLLYPVLIILGVASLASTIWAHRRHTALRGLEIAEDIQARAHRGGYLLLGTEELVVMHQEQNGHFLLVDTRPWSAFQSGHIKGAVCFPLAPTWWGRWSCRQVLAALLGPSKDRIVVFYCDAPTCVRSDSAARLAVQLDYKNVFRYSPGFSAWLEKELPVVRPS
jgi:rhodanese-related sulfurtransferase